MQRAARYFILPLLLAQLTGCAVGYYWQAGTGQMRIVRGQEAVEKLLDEAELTADERRRLEISQEALTFAHEEMLLPDNGSYRKYYDTGQPYVVWNVFAAPEFSLDPQTWCFPVAGCIAYRGYFKEANAHKYADKLGAKGTDVFVGGVTAYSTLGRLKDPLLNTMLAMAEEDFIGLLFHELAHQLLYIKDDSAFNEGFATVVEREGMRRWQAGRNELVQSQPRSTSGQRLLVLELLRDVRGRLTALYAADLDDAAKRAEKARILTGMGAEYQDLVTAWQAEGLDGRPYSAMFAKGFNNASLSAIATYDDYVPAFEVVLRNCAYDIECFYSRAGAIGALAPEQRSAKMQDLLTPLVSE
jgi:predicted aminopeptidase